MTVMYEWDHETTDQYGDVEDHNHADTLAQSGFDHQLFNLKGHDLVLVRDTDEGERDWAYCILADGKLVLPDCFSDSAFRPMPNMKVPQRFHKELERWQK